jgi:cytidylate kinase
MRTTICGKAGTGKSAGELVAAYYHIQFVSSGNYFRDIATRMGITPAKLEVLAQTDPQYDQEIDARTIRFGAENQNLVFDGRLAWYFIEDTFKVLLTCDFPVRIQRVADREKLSYGEAQVLTVEREYLQRERYLALYHIEKFDDEKNFDLVIDTTSISREAVAEKIRNGWLDHVSKGVTR